MIMRRQLAALAKPHNFRQLNKVLPAQKFSPISLPVRMFSDAPAVPEEEEDEEVVELT